MQRNGMYLSLAIQSELGGLGTAVTMFNKGVNERENKASIIPEWNSPPVSPKLPMLLTIL